jgi:hypothetical protein
MSVEKLGRTDDKVIQHIPSVSTSIGVTLSQTNNTFLRRDVSNTMTRDYSMNKHKLINLNEPAAADDALTRKYFDNSTQAVSDVCLRRDGYNTMTGDTDMTEHSLMHFGEPKSDNDA